MIVPPNGRLNRTPAALASTLMIGNTPQNVGEGGSWEAGITNTVSYATRWSQWWLTAQHARNGTWKIASRQGSKNRRPARRFRSSSTFLYEAGCRYRRMSQLRTTARGT